MKVYFYYPDATKGDTSREISDILDRSGVEIITKDQPVERAFPDTYRQVERRGESFLNYVDAIVIEGSAQDPEVGYLLAYAIAQKKPAILLMRKHATQHNPLATFGQRLPKTLTVSVYTTETLEKHLISFLQALGEITYQEIPSIKFTLRITPQIEHYLYWKTHNTKNTKADFLRNIILDEIIAKDADFEKYQKKGKKKENP